MSDPKARPLRIVLLGPPASGKGTQGKKLANSLGLGYLSTGAVLREQVENQTELGKIAAPILARGEYLPDDLMCRILADWLSKQSGGWILDGFPRSLPQAEFLDEWLSQHKLAIDCAISLEVPFAVLLQRISQRVECPDCRWTGQVAQLSEGKHCPVCGQVAQHRSDDNEENFRMRHQEFEKLTLPVVGHYRDENRLFTCDATAPQDEVAAKILAHFINPSCAA
ncbi:MAG: nucleoside monophosphate kinase [Akkermansiaceae bacterium]|nr:nucleoside monophosphate kinase [Akkermansiaceae bacterium]